MPAGSQALKFDQFSSFKLPNGPILKRHSSRNLFFPTSVGRLRDESKVRLNMTLYNCTVDVKKSYSGEFIVHLCCFRMNF